MLMLLQGFEGERGVKFWSFLNILPLHMNEKGRGGGVKGVSRVPARERKEGE